MNLQEATILALEGKIDEYYLSKYIESNFDKPLSHSALRVYNAIKNFNIPERDKKILAMCISYRFAGKTSTIPPFILDALNVDKMNGNYPKVGTIKWFIENPEAIKLYYDKYKGTDKLPFTNQLQQTKSTEQDPVITLYNSNTNIKTLYDFNSDNVFEIDKLKSFLLETELPIITIYGAYNKEMQITSKSATIKSLDYYGKACEISVGDKCVVVEFFDINDLA